MEAPTWFIILGAIFLVLYILGKIIGIPIKELFLLLKDEETVLMNLKQEHNDISFLKFGMKKESREKIDFQMVHEKDTHNRI